MKPRLAVIRPEPGNATTTAALHATGADVLSLPLFAVRPVEWTVPDLFGIDALLLTSANAVRHGRLEQLREKPVVAVGRATADAAREAGFAVVFEGTTDAAGVLTQATAQGYARLLHLAGRDRITLPGVAAVTVYASNPTEVTPQAAQHLARRTVLAHSVRAADRLATIIGDAGIDRCSISIAAISAAVADAAGDGWRAKSVAPQPTDQALIATALASAIDPSDNDEDNARQ